MPPFCLSLFGRIHIINVPKRNSKHLNFPQYVSTCEQMGRGENWKLTAFTHKHTHARGIKSGLKASQQECWTQANTGSPLIFWQNWDLAALACVTCRKSRNTIVYWLCVEDKGGCNFRACCKLSVITERDRKYMSAVFKFFLTKLCIVVLHKRGMCCSG